MLFNIIGMLFGKDNLCELVVVIAKDSIVSLCKNYRGGHKMELHITDSAAKWFKEEIEFEQGDMVKFYPKFYGKSPVQECYSLGFTRDGDPSDIAVKKEAEGIIFYIERDDLWYFDGHNLHVNYNEKIDELEYEYKKE